MANFFSRALCPILGTEHKNKNPEVCLSTGTTGYYDTNIRYLCFLHKFKSTNMKYTDQIRLLSEARINKYLFACGEDKVKTIQLYLYNIKLCQRFYGVICLFEIMLRNLIDEHYKKQFGPNWIVTQAKKNLLLENEANEIISLEKTYRNKNIYNHDKMVASFHFGFWTYLFSRRNFRVGGKTLLRIFPNKDHGLNQKQIYEHLSKIREFRNRIAHYEPICFNSSHQICTNYAKKHYNLIRLYIQFMGYNPDSIFANIEKPDKVLIKIDYLQKTIMT